MSSRAEGNLEWTSAETVAVLQVPVLGEATAWLILTLGLCGTLWMGKRVDLR